MSELSSDVMRGYNDLLVLFFLLEEPSYGYEISRQIRNISRERYVIKETTLYSAFTRLEKNGHIEAFSGSESQGKPRTYYRITPRGMEYYRKKCEEWKLTKEVIEEFIKELS